MELNTILLRLAEYKAQTENIEKRLSKLAKDDIESINRDIKKIKERLGLT